MITEIRREGALHYLRQMGSKDIRVWSQSASEFTRKNLRRKVTLLILYMTACLRLVGVSLSGLLFLSWYVTVYLRRWTLWDASRYWRGCTLALAEGEVKGQAPSTKHNQTRCACHWFESATSTPWTHPATLNCHLLGTHESVVSIAHPYHTANEVKHFPYTNWTDLSVYTGWPLTMEVFRTITNQLLPVVCQPHLPRLICFPCHLDTCCPASPKVIPREARFWWLDVTGREAPC